MLAWSGPRGAIRASSAGSFVRLWSVVAHLSLSLAETSGVLVRGRHRVPVVGCVVLVPFAWDVGAEEVRGDVDHGGAGEAAWA